MGLSTRGPDQPAHTGLVRDELMALRWLFGYGSDATVQHPGYPFQNIKMADVLILGLDIDAVEMDQVTFQRCHVGLSMFDTRDLQRFGHKAQIQSHHFVVGSPDHRREQSDKFVFGESEVILTSDLQQTFDKLISNRGCVLVTHGFDTEKEVLDSLGVILSPVCIIDTVKAAQYPLQLSYRYSLKGLLRHFEIPFAASTLHAAGNDAHYVLKALFMLAAVDAEANNVYLPWIPVLTQISRHKRPRTTREKEAERLTKTKSAARKLEKEAARLRNLAEEAIKTEKGGQACANITT